MNEAQTRDTFLSLVRNRMDPALRGADYDRCFNAVRAERPDLLDNRAVPTLAIANAFDPSQPRDEDGKWTSLGRSDYEAHAKRLGIETIPPQGRSEDEGVWDRWDERYAEGSEIEIKLHAARQRGWFAERKAKQTVKQPVAAVPSRDLPRRAMQEWGPHGEIIRDQYGHVMKGRE